MKTRILMVNEFSQLKTGYSTYGREILQRLHDSGKYEVAELATYVYPGDNRLNRVPWKVYCNTPSQEDKERFEAYNRSQVNKFGDFSFNYVVLNFKPHVVFDIRDFWMLEFEERSPFRKMFNWSIMPTVDAELQHEQWLATYAAADNVLTYTNWSKQLLEKETGGKISPRGFASPAASQAFQPLNKESIRKSLGLEDYNIIGTVMRNQRRKLYPILFESFRKYLDITGDKKTLLYCHTSYPDMGWDIPRLINRNNLSSKVVFTYVCGQCGNVETKFFNDSVTICRNCGKLASGLSNVQRGVSDESLTAIYNCFDLYVQLSNSEGFGMPQVEAAACGVPVASTDYSAMTEVVRKLKGYPIRLLGKTPELETGCLRAIPDGDHLVEIFKEYFSLRPLEKERKKIDAYDGFKLHYNDWDTTYQKWDELFESIDPRKYEELWNSPPNIQNPEPQLDEQKMSNMNNADYSVWLINRVLREPDRVGTYMHHRLLRDLNYGVTLGGTGGIYYNDNTWQVHEPNYHPFDRNKAYEHMYGLCQTRNHWEDLRMKTL